MSVGEEWEGRALPEESGNLAVPGARGSFWAAGAGPWWVSAWTARGTASRAHHTGLCLGWHRWPGRTTAGRRKESSAAGKMRGHLHVLPPPTPWHPWAMRDPHRAAPQVLQAQLVGELAHRHGVGHVLLVGKHQQHGIPQLVLLQLRRVRGWRPVSWQSLQASPSRWAGNSPFLPSNIFVGEM